jgi:hypothetical protein
MERNKELFYAIADKIESEPECWDQADWGNECGTKHCIAGWACHLSGYAPAVNKYGDNWWGNVVKDGLTIDIEDAACKELGLEPHEGDALFDEDWARTVPKAAIPVILRLYGDGEEIG